MTPTSGPTATVVGPSASREAAISTPPPPASRSPSSSPPPLNSWASAGSCPGCGSGVLAGAAATAGYAGTHGETVVVPPQAWAGGLTAAVIIGALAGLLPAIRAARLSPTQALWSI
jgi:hypothetical protein